MNQPNRFFLNGHKNFPFCKPQMILVLNLQLVNLACDYTQSCLGSERRESQGTSTCSSAAADKCDVYVCGSNSSHQVRK
jgi:hypothetical protein